MVGSDEWLLEVQRRMLRIRRFDERVLKMVSRGQLPGSLHTSIGQEAEVVGACMALAERDYITGNHRSHGHPIGKGSPLNPLMAELMGKATGVCKGKGGSMHLADFGVGSLGESGIVGSGIPIATGAGFASSVLKNGRVSLCFFGDGAANQGALHESLNLAAIWSLPVIYLCENNQYASTTATRSVTSVRRVAERAAAHGIPGVTVEDGQEVLTVHAAVSEAVERARNGGGPTLVEVMTYRYRQHSEGLRNIGDSRATDEREWWLARDPIALFDQELIRRGVATEESLAALAAEVDAEVDEAERFAKQSPYPEPEAAFEDLYSGAVERVGEPA